jgi:Ca-activated chloride channel family protein
VVQPADPVTAAARARVRAALAAIGARASTALHEGWLTGCQSIAGDIAPDGGRSLARCFLLTDGLANVGVVDPELIAADAARIREHAGIGTSTFGIGADYDERLLGPMAVAGGGQFHHLRAASEIASTFVGELGGLLAVAASRVRLELEVEWGVTVDVVSAYWARTASPDEPAGAPGGRRWSIAIGDLLAGEERHVVVRFGFPSASGRYTHAVRARLAWSAAGIEWSTTWQEVGFSYADHGTCDAEVRDQAVMHWVGLHHADRARREAAEQSRRGDLREAREGLRKVASQIASYADSDSALQAALRELQAVEHEVAAAPVAAMVAKELAAESYRRSRGQRDLRSLRCSEE